MQQAADICPLLLLVIHNVLHSCRHGGHKRLRSDKHKLTKADLQPIELEQSDRFYCNCGTPPAVGYNQGGLQSLYPTCLTRTEDLSQRIDRLQHFVESQLASDREFMESTISGYDRIERQFKKIFPYAFLEMEETTKEHDDADSKIFDSSTEGILCNYYLSQKIDRLQHSVESLLASRRDLIQRTGTGFARLENLCKRALPDVFLTMEKTIKDHEGASSTIFDYTMEDVLPSYDLFQRFARLQHSVDRLMASSGDFVKSMASRAISLRKRVYPHAVLALEQIEERAQGSKQQDHH